MTTGPLDEMLDNLVAKLHQQRGSDLHASVHALALILRDTRGWLHRWARDNHARLERAAVARAERAESAAMAAGATESAARSELDRLRHACVDQAVQISELRRALALATGKTA